MRASDHHESAPAFPREIHSLLNLFKRLWSNVELWERVEGLRPRMVVVRGCGAKRYLIGVHLLDLLGDFGAESRVHFAGCV